MRLGRDATVKHVTDRDGTPLRAATDGTDTHEVRLGPAALADILPSVTLPRANRVVPATPDGMELGRLPLRRMVERRGA